MDECESHLSSSYQPRSRNYKTGPRQLGWALTRATFAQGQERGEEGVLGQWGVALCYVNGTN